MDEKIILFKELADLYSKHGYQLYMVGGSTRDYLLNIPLTDMDLVTDATPEEEKIFLDNADYTFSKYGSIKLKYKNVKFDITTMREEDEYIDSRHPLKISFTRDLSIDVRRRDFTLNALYLNKDLEVIDFVNGQKDLSNKALKMIGNPDIRLKEDPLRIVRAFRFSYDLGLTLDKNLLKAIEDNKELLSKLRIEKIKEEIHKCHHKDTLISKLKELGINNL